MKLEVKLTVTQRIMGLAAMFLAFQALCRKGVVAFDANHDVKLKVPASQAFTIAIHPATDALETLTLWLVLVQLMIEKGIIDCVYDVDRAIHQSLQRGRLATIPWPLPELPKLKPEPDLEPRVLQRLISLEKEGRI